MGAPTDRVQEKPCVLGVGRRDTHPSSPGRSSGELYSVQGVLACLLENLGGSTVVSPPSLNLEKGVEIVAVGMARRASAMQRIHCKMFVVDVV